MFWLLFVLVVLLALIVYAPPKFIIDLLANRDPNVLFRVKTNKKIVGLTIDDGPSENTPNILRVLKKYNVKATFFVIGSQIENHRDVIKQILDDGHELGNHTMYNKTSLFLSNKELESQIQTLDAIIHPNEQPKTKWFRPGFGYYNKRLLGIVERCGYSTALGDVYPHDYYLPFPKLNSLFVLNKVQPGSIVILHDLDHTVDALEQILPALQKTGYAVGSLSTITGK